LARHARIVAAGYPLRVIVRGIDLAAIFFSESDRQCFLGSLGEVVAAEANGTCLCADDQPRSFSDHADDRAWGGPADEGPRFPLRSVSQPRLWANRYPVRGRFRSSLIDGDRYLLACQRYIELNPVRAGLAADPGAYPWSSYRSNALGAPDPLLTPQPLYVGLGETDEARRTAYRDLFAEALAPDVLTEIRTATNGGFALGGERFQREIAAMLGPRTWRGRLGRPRDPQREAEQKGFPI
jgi:putative transposase